MAAHLAWERSHWALNRKIFLMLCHNKRHVSIRPRLSQSMPFPFYSYIARIFLQLSRKKYSNVLRVSPILSAFVVCLHRVGCPSTVFLLYPQSLFSGLMLSSWKLLPISSMKSSKSHRSYRQLFPAPHSASSNYNR